jgi:hypothetical protein
MSLTATASYRSHSSFARSTQKLRDKACRRRRTGTPASASRAAPLIAFVEQMHFVMLIRKWSADFFSLRPHQNVGPSQGGRDQRRQRSVDDDVGEQPVDVDARWICCVWALHIGLCVHWLCALRRGVTRPLSVCLCARASHPGCPDAWFTSHAKHAGCFQCRTQPYARHVSRAWVVVCCRQRDTACAGSCYLQYHSVGISSPDLRRSNR